jgi:endonuclease/exonuclease/phosphatase family metal-dependent hydrolase
MRFRTFALFAPLWLFVSVAFADLKVGTLNCYFLFDPAKPEKTRLADKGPTTEQYPKKIGNLTSLITGLDVIGLQEIASGHEAKELAKKAGGYRAWFVQGKDTFTGQDVATLVKEDSQIKVISAQRNSTLEGLSKHLVVLLTEGSTRYAILNVHLIRPIGQNKEKHAAQLKAIEAWVAATKANDANTVIVVLGDFNDSRKGMLPLLSESGSFTGYAPTHLANEAYDWIFTSGKLSAVEIVRPPYPKRPNDDLKMIWTDHYLLKATVR